MKTIIKNSRKYIIAWFLVIAFLFSFGNAYGSMTAYAKQETSIETEKDAKEQETTEQGNSELDNVITGILDDSILESEEEATQDTTVEDMVSKNIVMILIVLSFIFVLMIVLIVAGVAVKKKEKQRLAQRLATEIRRQQLEEKKHRIMPTIDATEGMEVEDVHQGETPVIKVDDVTMVFKVATSNVSGLKEYVIRKLQHKLSHREMYALDHVSFDVYKGEVVGIIGTNGSGKSTLLKIVAGALNPSKGHIEVDQDKVQLLTLGTGFDPELSAKENVYLNGAIVGYTKEFIDQHYDEIVEFAELDGFMEEKVKNFSSGMVSRLGFAIATAGDAAEILILDEVLSVGDEFFSKKSMNKIKGMIRGGSTVIMVSHSVNTIKRFCDKAVWIEKGKLKMVGNPRVVCKKYECFGE